MQVATSTDKMRARTLGAVGHLIFNNPEKRNAVSLEMWRAADEILDGFERDDDVRVLVLSGAGGKSFVSGADISEFGKERSTEEAVRHYNERTAAVYARLECFAKPTIAMIDGYCIGGGLNLATACDLRICSTKSSFAMPAARLALGYPFHAIRRLASIIGIANARDLMFSARRVASDEAHRMGLVQAVLGDDELESFVSDYANTVAANAPLTVGAMKFISTQVVSDPGERDLERCAAMVADCFASADYAEGRKAFAEKRKPVFKGR